MYPHSENVGGIDQDSAHGLRSGRYVAWEGCAMEFWEPGRVDGLTRAGILLTQVLSGYGSPRV